MSFFFSLPLPLYFFCRVDAATPFISIVFTLKAMLARRLPLVLPTHTTGEPPTTIFYTSCRHGNGAAAPGRAAPFFGADDIVVATMKGPYAPMCVPLIRCEVLHQIQLHSHHALLQHWC